MEEPSSSWLSSTRGDDTVKRNLKHLEPLDELLRCRICFEYFTVCMMTKCSHNYCSLCIRKYMTYKAQCPTCFLTTSEPELRNNRQLDEILMAYRQLRGTLEQCLQGDVKLPLFSEQTSNFELNTSVKHCSVEEIENVLDASDSAAIELAKQSSIEEEDLREVSEEQEKVPCPVCAVPVSIEKINLHLDACLSREERKVTLRRYSGEMRKPLPKVVYHLLSDKELKKKLKECGLNTSGDRQMLIRRHKAFLVLYNSDCDSLKPKPVSDIIKQAEKEEREEKMLEKQHTILAYDKKSDPEIIEQQQLQYLKHHDKQFKRLIDDIRSRSHENLKRGKCQTEELADQEEQALLSGRSSRSATPERFEDSRAENCDFENNNIKAQEMNTEGTLQWENAAENTESLSVQDYEGRLSAKSAKSAPLEIPQYQENTNSKRRVKHLRKRKIDRSSYKEAGRPHQKK